MVKRRTEDRSAGEHVLLTVLGTRPRSARYALNGRVAHADVAPIALVELLAAEDGPDRVLALCTPEAKRDSWPKLECALTNRCPVDSVEVPGGTTQEEVDGFLKALTSSVPEDVELTVDLTHGYRHFAFLMYVAVLYLAALRDVRVRGAYYGLLNPEPKPSPFLDLRPLLELPRWIHAVATLRETGSAVPMARILEGDNPFAKQDARDLARDLQRLSQAYLSGLPLELGRQAWEVRRRRKSMRRLLRGVPHRLPLADELTGQLDQTLQRFVLPNASGLGWKRSLPLSEAELKRQARMIDDLLCRESFAVALGLMSEWTVSWVAWVRGPSEAWLDYRKVRRSAAGLLGATRAMAQSELRDRLTDDQRRLGDFWRRLSDLRNGYAHHGMRRQDLEGRGIDAKRRKVTDYWRNTLRSLPDFSLRLGDSPGGRILVSPIGLRPGVLFSALQACRAEREGRDPALCLVICSPETEVVVAEAVRRADYRGAVERLVVGDAVGGGAGEIKRLAAEARGHFLGLAEVCVNVTGGTTLMGLIAERLAAEARKLACPVRRFGLIDRRSAKEQKEDPYQAGQAFWLDEEATRR